MPSNAAVCKSLVKINAGFFSTPRATSALATKANRPLAKIIDLYHFILANANWGNHYGAAKGELLSTVRSFADHFGCSASTVMARLSKLERLQMIGVKTVSVDRVGNILNQQPERSRGRYSRLLIAVTPVRAVSKFVSDCIDFKNFAQIKNRTLNFKTLAAKLLTANKPSEPPIDVNSKNRTLNDRPSIYNEYDKEKNITPGVSKNREHLFQKVRRHCQNLVEAIEQKDLLTENQGQLLKAIYKDERRFAETYRSLSLNPSIGDPAGILAWRMATWLKRKNLLTASLNYF